MALPVLFPWEVFSWGLSSVGAYRRCHRAIIPEQQAQVAALDEKIPRALCEDRKGDERRISLEDEHAEAIGV